MGTIREHKFKLIKNFLNSEELEIAKTYSLIKHKNNDKSFDTNQNNNGDTFLYIDALSETLLLKKLPLMEKETGLKLFPTYSFMRVYSYNAELLPHTDRPSCEISVTVMYGSDGTPWPIYMEDTPINMNPGDACIYLGCELNHYRENFEGDWHAQAFLHYVDQHGLYSEFKYDKRYLSLDL